MRRSHCVTTKNTKKDIYIGNAIVWLCFDRVLMFLLSQRPLFPSKGTVVIPGGGQKKKRTNPTHRETAHTGLTHTETRSSEAVQSVCVDSLGCGRFWFGSLGSPHLTQLIGPTPAHTLHSHSHHDSHRHAAHHHSKRHRVVAGHTRIMHDGGDTNR